MKKPSKGADRAPVARAENRRNGMGAPRRKSPKQARPEKPSGPTDGTARLRATIEASVDCVITIDAQSNILEFNAAAERTFGYAREEVIGKPLTDAIIPPSLREAHRRGMAALLKGGTGKLLGRRVEMQAMRADSSEFPVELTVTQIDSQDPPLFTAYLRDITERKRAEEALKQAEDRTRLVINTIPTIALSLLPDGTVDFVNQRWMNYTGLSLAEEVAEPMRAMHPEDRPRVLQRWLAAKAAGETHVDELRLRRADGEYRWFLIRTAPLRDEQGNIVRWYGTSTDIEERKRAEEALKQGEDRTRLVIDTIPTMAWSLGADGRVEFVNQRWMDYTGLSLEEEVKEPARPVHPEDLPRVMAKWRVDSAAGEMCEDEMRLRRADGEYRWFLVRTAPLRDEEGNIIKWYGVSIDIEDRKQAELQARELIDAIPHQIWSGPPDGTMDYCNARWRSYAGIGLKDLQGDGWRAMLHPNDRERVLKAWRESVVNGTPYQQEERHLGADGNYRWFVARGVPLRDTEGRIVRWYGTNTDVEDRKRTQEALRKNEKLFALFMDQLPGFAWMKDMEGRYLWLNKKEAQLDAYREGAIGKTDSELWPAEIAATYQANDEKAIAARQAVQAVEPSLFNGERGYMLVAKFPIFAANGAVEMVGGAGFDITDRLLAEQALRESEQRFRELAENIHEVFWLSDDQNARMLYISPAYERVWGRSCESLYAAPRSWIEAVHPEDKEQVLASLAQRSHNQAYRNTYRIVRPDGSIRWIRDRGFPVRDESGAAIRFAGIAEDMTERKQAEQARERGLSVMLATLESTADGILVVNTEGKIETFNRLFARMWRLPDEVLASKEDARALECVLDQLIDPGKFLEKVHYLYQHPEEESFDRLVFKDGRVFERYSRPQLIGGKVAGRVWSFRDITERMRAAEELRKANHQLRILSRQLFHIQEEERRHLARELHDEIGQTLTAAKINLKIIAPDVPAEITGRFDDSVQLLDRLLKQVRELSLNLRPPLLDELGLVPTLRWLVDQQAQRAQLRATFTADVNGLEIDPATQTTCFRVAQEAITNIIRHAGAKSVSVELWHEAERLWLSVRDDGAGFDPVVMQQRAPEHSTLGLVSMKERALLVGGGLEVHSAPGQGTEIRAWFPLPRGEPSSGTETRSTSGREQIQ